MLFVIEFFRVILTYFNFDLLSVSSSSGVMNLSGSNCKEFYHRKYLTSDPMKLFYHVTVLFFLELITSYSISKLNSRELVSLFYWNSQNENTKFDIKKLEERALDLCDVMNIHQLRDVVFFLANQNQRNTTLLRAVGHCMAQQSFVVLNINHLCNLIYSFAKLSYCEENLMMLISSCIISKVCNCLYFSTTCTT